MKKGPQVTRINPVHRPGSQKKDRTPGEEKTVILVVRGYDPVRRTGRAKAPGVKRRIHFKLRHVPEPIRERVLQVSQQITARRAAKVPHDEIAPLLDECRAHIVHQHFEAILFVNQSRLWSLRKMLRVVEE